MIRGSNDSPIQLRITHNSGDSIKIVSQSCFSPRKSFIYSGLRGFFNYSYSMKCATTWVLLYIFIAYFRYLSNKIRFKFKKFFALRPWCDSRRYIPFYIEHSSKYFSALQTGTIKHRNILSSFLIITSYIQPLFC